MPAEMHPLDRPVWASLTTRQAALATGGELAWRFRPDVNVFASARDDTAASLAALAELVGDVPIYVLQRAPIPDVPGLVVHKEATGIQMVATRRLGPEAAGPPTLDLSDDDAADMLALATLTEPGPFLARTHVMGRFRGIRRSGRLVAMAGERLQVPGYTEISGVCTHPEARGGGLARRLSAIVAEAIFARGEVPFLHAWAANHAAIRLYEQLGFVPRTEVHVRVLA